MLRHRKKHDSGVSSGGDDVSDDTDSESGGAASVSIDTGSMEDRSSPEDLAGNDNRISDMHRDFKDDVEIPTKQQSEIKKKRLMDKINMLSSAVTTSTDGNIAKMFDKASNGKEIK